MTDTIRHVFARGHTARGGYSLYASALQGTSRLYALQGASGADKSALLGRLAAEAAAQGLQLRLYHAPLDPGEIEAFAVTDAAVAFADDAVCRPLPEGIDVRTVSLDDALVPDSIDAAVRERLSDREQRRAAAYAAAYDAFAEALRIHDEWESFYIESMDFREADAVAKETAERLFQDRRLEKPAAVRHQFFGAATPGGAYDYILSLTAELPTRIYVKGRAGTGKSTLLKRLAAEAETRGFDVDVFHCGFDPNSLDMLILPELGTAIFDSTAPHEYDPQRDGDEILDMYARVIAPGIDERYAAELGAIKRRYAAKMQEATAFLGEARSFDRLIRDAYAAAMDSAAVERLYRELRAVLFESAASAAADTRR